MRVCIRGQEVQLANAIAEGDWQDRKAAFMAMGNDIKDVGTGAVKGDFVREPNWKTVAGQILAGLTPAGLAADGRDSVANGRTVVTSRGKQGKLALAFALVGFVPLVGDGVKVWAKSANAAPYADEALELAASGKKLGVELFQHGDEIANALPANGLFARVMNAKRANEFLNDGSTFAGKMDIELAATKRVFKEGEVFIGAYDDVKNIRTPAGMSERLTLLTEKTGGHLKEGVDTAIVFRAPNGTTIATPVNAKLRGYGNTGRGTTDGGAREWVIPNGTRAELEAKGFKIEQVYSLNERGVRTEWQHVVRDGKMSWEPLKPTELTGIGSVRSTRSLNKSYE